MARITRKHILTEETGEARTPVRYSLGDLTTAVIRIGVSSRSYAPFAAFHPCHNALIDQWTRTGDYDWASDYAQTLLLTEARARLAGRR